MLDSQVSISLVVGIEDSLETKATFCGLEDDAVEPFISLSKTLRLLYKSSKLRLSTPGLVLIIKETCDQAEDKSFKTVASIYTSASFLGLRHFHYNRDLMGIPHLFSASVHLWNLAQVDLSGRAISRQLDGCYCNEGFCWSWSSVVDDGGGWSEFDRLDTIVCLLKE
ncbi:retrovirus-related pol polyprotein from transposon TNT 1-94 [Tanacetum coccineum]